MDFGKEYLKLNEPQKVAVDTIDGPLIVIAGPGTGKTQLLSMRTANILKQTDVLPSNILCLTFTENAAENMRSRLLKLIGQSANKVNIFTFHGFGTHIIQNYPEFFYDSPLITPLNELGEYSIIEKLMNKLHHDNPLAKKVNDTYLHLPSIMRTISLFKQAGLTANQAKLNLVKNQDFFKDANKLLNKAFSASPSPKYIDNYNELLRSMILLNEKFSSEVGVNSSKELAVSIDNIDPSSRFAQSITAWRNKWLTQVSKGNWQFGDQSKNTFTLRVIDLYEEYQSYLVKNALYTFDDMILRTVESLKQNEELKLTLQEIYQYILVDEYQDTNGAQDKILSLLSDNPINEGKPNLMVVGDDDQAIYRFQGANSSVMSHFIEKWKPEKIVLKDNYRSGQPILDLAREIIINANDRLENQQKDIEKSLDSKAKISKTIIQEIYSTNEQESYINVAKQIKQLVDNGQNPSTIAVLAPKHRYLENIAPHLLGLDLPVSYERREQILMQPRIIELLTLVELIHAASNNNFSKIESLLPNVLASDYWQLNPDTLWRIAINAQKDRRGWFNVLEDHEDTNLNNFARAIKYLAKESKNNSFELILAYLSGNKPIKLIDAESWSMPWREYYFSDEKIENDTSEYINFMSQLTTLKNTYNEWQPEVIRLRDIKDFETFINLCKKAKIRLDSTNPYVNSNENINLMTVYKAKGLEWDTVIILNGQEEVWGSKARTRNQSFSLPSTLKWIEPAIDISNDLIRLFFVGLTRARSNLYISTYQYKANGQLSERLTWLTEILPDPKLITPLDNSSVVDLYERSWRDLFTDTTTDLSSILKPLLEHYKLSSTHLIDFLAVDKGGPKYFLYRHLLKVPDELNNNAMYGDSIHKTLEFVHKQTSTNNMLPPNEQVLLTFEEKLSNHPLTNDEFKYFKKKGVDNLTSWLDQNGKTITASDISEYDFSGEHIVLDEAKITGKIDVIRKVSKDELVVVDYKTSQPLSSWMGTNTNQSIKISNYKTQLIFYKLLLENSQFIKTGAKITSAEIDFLTPNDDNQYVNLVYEYEKSEIDRIVNIIPIIWKKIMNLDLPNTDNYQPNYKGIRSFEDDLLAGAI